MYKKLTYDAEGSDDPKSPYFSGVLHWPGGASGVTIGHGYDLGHRSPSEVAEHFAHSGIDAPWLLKACGRTGEDAKQFVKQNKDRITLTVEQMELLFDISYEEQRLEVVRLCTKADVVKAYGETDFDTLDERIYTMLIDLKFRGDYTGSTRRLMQRFVVANDFESFRRILVDRSNWERVPADRFRRRRQYLNA